MQVATRANALWDGFGRILFWQCLSTSSSPTIWLPLMLLLPFQRVNHLDIQFTTSECLKLNHRLISQSFPLCSTQIALKWQTGPPADNCNASCTIQWRPGAASAVPAVSSMTSTVMKFTPTSSWAMRKFINRCKAIINTFCIFTRSLMVSFLPCHDMSLEKGNG